MKQQEDRAVALAPEEFDSLKCGDTVFDVTKENAWYVNQVRLPGMYVVARVDPKTLDRLDRAYLMLSSPEGIAFVLRKEAR